MRKVEDVMNRRKKDTNKRNDDFSQEIEPRRFFDLILVSSYALMSRDLQNNMRMIEGPLPSAMARLDLWTWV